MTKLGSCAVHTFCFLLLAIGIYFFAPHVAEKESRRLDAVKEYNCKHFGEQMRKDYGDTVCTPTINR